MAPWVGAVRGPVKPMPKWPTDIFGAAPESPGRFLVLIVVSAVLFAALFWGLHQLGPRVKKWLTIVVTFLAGLFFLFEYFWPARDLPGGGQGNWVTPLVAPVSDFVVAMVMWVLFLGVISLFVIHGRKLFAFRAGWHDSLAFFLAFFLILVVGLVGNLGEPGEGAGGVQKAASEAYGVVFYGLLANLDAAMFALLAFYISSASYRAFRVRSVEALLMMVSAVVVMLGMVSIGEWLTQGLPEAYRLDAAKDWILAHLNMPGQRAVTIGVSVGALAMALRIWLSLERGAFFSQES